MVFVACLKPAWVGVVSCLHLICQLVREPRVVSPGLGEVCVGVPVSVLPLTVGLEVESHLSLSCGLTVDYL